MSGPGENDGGDSSAADEPAGGGTAAKPGQATAVGVDAGASTTGSVVVQDALPDTMFVFPLKKAVPFPQLMMPLLLDSQAAREIVAKAEAHNGYVFLVLQKDPEQDAPRAGDVHDVGVITRILKTLKLPDGGMSAMTQGVRRARIVKAVREKPHLVARVKELVEIPARGERPAAMFRLLQKQLRQLAELQEQLDSGFATALLNVEDGGQLADFSAGVVRAVTDRQRLLEQADVEKRLELALQFAMAESELAALDKQILGEIRDKAEKAQKDYFLREQMKIIRRELGEEKDPRALELQRLEAAIEKARMPEAALRRAREELTRLQTTPVESGEYGVVRNYLDWLVALPWSVSTTDDVDLARAARVLDDDHFGLDEVKDRILEFLAVRKLRPGNAGSILCFAGPPGVGKTSLGRSIARAMGRKFWRFSLGGMRDEAEIKGHRRTYVGALPGKLVQALRRCGTMNPVILLDEIDKLSRGVQGDPAATLLEVLDPEQNKDFLDHYLDIRVDLSRILFVCTANEEGGIPEPLHDRMEVIRLSGYVEAEKVAIARKHLLPKQREAHGLSGKDLALSEAALRTLVRGYAREAGVRRLEQLIARICRKVATAKAKAPQAFRKASLGPADLVPYVGKPLLRDDDLMPHAVAGVVTGLAWTSLGGATLEIEAVATHEGEDKGGLVLTGQLGDVMKESANLARSYLMSRTDLGIPTGWFESHRVHLHVPAGATPKDGPSAGITMATALLSLATGRPVRRKLGMTGELTLTGRVYPIGGVREKLIAAKRSGLSTVLLPQANERDYEDLPEHIREGIDVRFVSRLDEVLGFAGLAGEAGPGSVRKSKGRVVRKKGRSS